MSLLVALLGVVVSVAPPAGADEQPPAFVTTWGSEGSAPGQFLYPWGVAVDSAGNVYVADRDNHRIQRFTSDGTFVAEWGTYGDAPGQFKNPYGVAIDGDDRLYVVDTANNRVQKFATDGQFLTQWGSLGAGDGQFNEPQGVAVDGAGNVYVADGANHRVERFTSEGTYLGQWGANGTGPGRFNYPRDVATDPAGNVYVADTNNHRIQRFTSAGTFLTQWGGFGTGPGQFDSPFAVRVDGAGHVYVADYHNDRMQKFTATGAFLTQWGGLGTGDGQFDEPQGVAVDPAGNVYVSDADNYRVQKFAPAAQGAVAGTVTESGSGAPVAGAWLAVLRTADFSIAGSAVADGAGAFRAEVAPGSYFLYVVDPTGRHVSGFHEPVEPLAVSAGADLAADPVVASTRGTIAGTIRDADTSAAIAGAWGMAFSGTTGALEAVNAATGAGEYAVAGLAGGDHYVGWLDPTGAHVVRFWPSSAAMPSGSPRAVTAGATTTADGSLPAQAPVGTGSVLSGTVTESGTGAPVTGARVVALRAADLSLARATVADGSGGYSLDLAAGSYVLAFVDAGGTHDMEWYDDQPSTGLGSAAPVSAPGTANAALRPSGGDVTGTVVDALGQGPLAGAWVVAIGPSGPAGGAIAGADGTYLIEDLPPGTYRLTFVDPHGGRRQEFWDGAAGYGGATPFAVTAGAEVTRDADLALP